MKKKILIGIIIAIVVLLASLLIPVRKGEVWVNDSEISDVGHYEQHYFNLYGGDISSFFRSSS